MEKQNKFADILKLKSGFYRGVNEDYKPVTVYRIEGKGFEISTPTHDGWHEVVGYDEDGYQEYVTYRK